MAGPGELTAELRLWWRGGAPDAVATWFGAGDAAPEEARRDTYLLTDNPALGLKQRGENGGGIECKSLIAAFDAGLAVGTAEVWVKCTARGAHLPSGHTLEVAKARRLRHFAIRQDAVEETEHEGESACAVELGTARAADGEAWASLCFEAQATLAGPTHVLCEVWKALAPPAACATGLAMSYPAWLKRVAPRV